MYRGEWYKNQRHGNGIMYWLTLNEVYDGQWESGLQHGFGKHTLWMRDSNDNTQVSVTAFHFQQPISIIIMQ